MAEIFVGSSWENVRIIPPFIVVLVILVVSDFVIVVFAEMSVTSTIVDLDGLNF